MDIKLNKFDWIFLLLCLVLGIAAEESFFRDTIGVSYLVFIILFYAVFYWRFRGFTFSHQRFGYLVLICIWLLAISYANIYAMVDVDFISNLPYESLHRANFR
jgi:hypothetical protein